MHIAHQCSLVDGPCWIIGHVCVFIFYMHGLQFNTINLSVIAHQVGSIVDSHTIFYCSKMFVLLLFVAAHKVLNNNKKMEEARAGFKLQISFVVGKAAFVRTRFSTVTSNRKSILFIFQVASKRAAWRQTFLAAAAADENGLTACYLFCC